jgi:hypothetical protein
MLISRGHAKRLVRLGKAVEDNAAYDDDGNRWQIVERLDIQRVDHYPLHPGQATYIQVTKASGPEIMPYHSRRNGL